MQQDFLNELAELALGSRLKRISERMLASASDVYQELGVSINPKWFTLMALLDAKDNNEQLLSIVEASDLLGLSQPALSQFCKELQDEKLLNIIKDPADSRNRILILTPKGRKRVREMKPIRKAVQQAPKNYVQKITVIFIGLYCCSKNHLLVNSYLFARDIISIKPLCKNR